MPLAGTQASGVHLAFYAHKHGQIPLDELITCLAIARGESLWYDKAYNPNASTGDNSYGVWQVNLLGRLRAARLVQLGLSEPEDLFDLATNARCMGVLYREALSWGRDSGWSPWGAYTNGSYRRHLGPATEAVEAYKARLAESEDRLHIGGVDDCDSL